MQVSGTPVQTTQLQASPAEAAPRRVTEATRIPMSLPTTKLAVPQLPGYYLYWHLGKNVPAAIRAGYDFVKDDEIELEQHGLANAADETGNTDLGSNISVAAGQSQFDERMQPERLYLMKLPLEWHLKDQAALGAVNESVAQSIRSGMLGSQGDPDANKRYMKKGQDLFYPKRPG